MRGVRVTLSGSRLRYLAGGCAGLRVCGCAGLRVLGCVIRLVWSISRLVGAGAREPAGSRLRYLVLGYVIWLVVVRVCGFAGARVCGF